MTNINCEKINEIFQKEILEILKKYDVEEYKFEVITTKELEK